MANEPATVTFKVRPGGSCRVEKDPDTGEEKSILVEPDTSDNEHPGGNVEEPAPAAARTGKGRR